MEESSIEFLHETVKLAKEHGLEIESFNLSKEKGLDGALNGSRLTLTLKEEEKDNEI